MAESPRPAPKATPPDGRKFGMSLRDLVIALLSIVAGVGAAVLLSTAGVPVGQAVLGGFTAFGATVYFLDRIVE